MTTYYFIRHCEKETDTYQNPHLTEKGKKRAAHWAAYFKDKKINLIYSTDLNRTLETVHPLAVSLGLQPMIYNPSNLYIEDFLKQTKGKCVLIAGHQDSTPNFVNVILKERKYPYIENHNFENLYIIEIDKDGNATDKLLKVEF